VAAGRGGISFWAEIVEQIVNNIQFERSSAELIWIIQNFHSE